MKRADIKVGDHLNYIDPSDDYGRDNEVIVLSDVPWTKSASTWQHASIVADIDGVERTIGLTGGTRPTERGNGVLVVFADCGWGGWGSPYGLVVQLRYLSPWTEESEAKAVAARELYRQTRQTRSRAFHAQNRGA